MNKYHGFKIINYQTHCIIYSINIQTGNLLKAVYGLSFVILFDVPGPSKSICVFVSTEGGIVLSGSLSPSEYHSLWSSPETCANTTSQFQFSSGSLRADSGAKHLVNNLNSKEGKHNCLGL